MPPSFIDDKKLDMLLELRKKIQDEQVKKDVELIWEQWSKILHEKEQQEANHPYINPLSSPPSEMSVASPACVTLSGGIL